MRSQLKVLKNEYIEVKVCPEVGAGIFSLRCCLGNEWVDIMRPTPIEAVVNRSAGDFACFNMIPYSNRIENAVLKFRGKTYNLEKNTPEGHSIHGDVRFRPWHVLFEGAERIIMGIDSRDFDDMAWPFPFYAEAEYRLSGAKLAIRLMLKNTGNDVMPGGMGIHPYFMRKLTPQDDVVILKAPMKGIYPGDSTIPTGHWIGVPQELDFSQERELGIQHLDKCYRIFHAPTLIMWPGSKVKLTMEADKIFKHTILYSPKVSHEFFAVEPVTNCNNGFNMAEEGIEDTGTVYLQPGDSITGNIFLEIEKSD